MISGNCKNFILRPNRTVPMGANGGTVTHEAHKHDLKHIPFQTIDLLQWKSRKMQNTTFADHPDEFERPPRQRLTLDDLKSNKFNSKTCACFLEIAKKYKLQHVQSSET